MLSRGDYNWSRTQALERQHMECTYMGMGDQECEIVKANVTRLCNEYGVWMEPNTSKCYTEITENLCIIRNVRTIIFIVINIGRLHVTIIIYRLVSQMTILKAL